MDYGTATIKNAEISSAKYPGSFPQPTRMSPVSLSLVAFHWAPKLSALGVTERKICHTMTQTLQDEMGDVNQSIIWQPISPQDPTKWQHTNYTLRDGKIEPCGTSGDGPQRNYGVIQRLAISAWNPEEILAKDICQLTNLEESIQTALQMERTKLFLLAAEPKCQPSQSPSVKSIGQGRTRTPQTFSSFGGRPRFRGLWSCALFSGDFEPLSDETEETRFFPSPVAFFNFPSDKPALRFSSLADCLPLSSLELRRFFSSVELWEDAWEIIEQKMVRKEEMSSSDFRRNPRELNADFYQAIWW